MESINISLSQFMSIIDKSVRYLLSVSSVNYLSNYYKQFIVTIEEGDHYYDMPPKVGRFNIISRRLLLKKSKCITYFKSQCYKHKTTGSYINKQHL